MTELAPTNIRVLLIHDQAIMRAGLRLLIECHPGLSVVGEVALAESLTLAMQELPDIILLDLGVGSESAINLLPKLLAVATCARVIALVDVPDPECHRQAIRLGAMGLLMKDQPEELLIRAIQKVHAGEIWLDRSLAASVLAEIINPRQHQIGMNGTVRGKNRRLTDREQQVATLVAEGLTNREIAARLSIRPVTVSHHLTAIFAKLDIKNRFDLVVYVLRNGLQASED